LVGQLSPVMKRSLRDTAAATTLWLGLSSGCEVVLSFAILMVLARRLAPENFGMVALSLAVMKTFTTFNRELFLQAVIQHDDLSERHFSSIFWSGGIFGILCAAMVWLLSPALADLFNAPNMVHINRALAVLRLISGLEAILEAQAQRNFQAKRLGLALVTGRMMGGTAGVVLAMGGMGVWSLVVQQILLRLAPFLLMLATAPRLPRIDFSWSYAKELLVYGVKIAPGRLLDALQMPIFVALCGHFFGAGLVGHLDIARRLVESLRQLLWQTVDRVVFPVFSEGRRRGRSIIELYKSGLERLCLLIFPIFSGLLALAPEVISVLFGDKWASSVVPMQGVAITSMLIAVQRFSTLAMASSGKPQMLTLSSGIGAVVLLLLMALIGRESLNLAILCWCLSNLVMSGVGAVLFEQTLGASYRDMLTPLRTPAIAAGLMIGVLSLGRTWVGPEWPPVAILAVAVPVGAVTFLSVSYALNRRLVLSVASFIRNMV
jgi:polysaccharide transporter, PST family